MRPLPLTLALLPLCLTLARSQDPPPPTLLPPVVVTGERLAPTGPVIAEWDDTDLATFAPRTVDELLATGPAFSFFRRQSAVFGNPTTSGVSLRRTGATATARTLVTLDGVPQNDPFGGWVSWARYRPEALDGARLVPSAQAAVWGNGSPAGTVQLTSRTPSRNTGHVELTAGSHDTWGTAASADAVSPSGHLAASVSGFSYATAGFHTLSQPQRGAVDRPLDLDFHGGAARFVWRASDSFTLEPAVSFFSEDRGNGTAYSRNSTRAVDLSLRATHETPDLLLQALAYYQHREFDARFASVAADRNSERPALDQFDVPGQGLGGSLTAHLRPADNLDLLVGADLRHLDGETNERAAFVGGSFLRGRRAGGFQLLTGAFARASLLLGADHATVVDATARLDYWSLDGGERVERRPATGALLRNDQFADRDGFEPSFSLAAEHPLTETLTVDASAGTGFRLPTINELYRPFRVRSDITEANPELDPERFISASAGLTWEPSDTLTVGLGAFLHHIDDAIANVPVTDPAAAAALVPFVPPGGSVAQRQNVDSARSWGLEARTRWEPAPDLALSLNYLFSQTEFTDSPSQPLLDGQAFPQSPEHRLNLTVEARPNDRLLVFTGLDFGSQQADDALGTRPLDPYLTVRLGAHLQLNDQLSLHARVENLFDEEVQTGLSSNALLTTGTPRSAWLSLRYTF